MPLRITRKVGESVSIGESIRVVVTAIKDECVKLAITAPRDVQILRDNAVHNKPKNGAPVGATRRNFKDEG